MTLHRTRVVAATILAACLAAGASRAGAQAAADSAKPKAKYVSSKFWESSEPLDFTLVVNLKQLQGDKKDSVPWRWANVRAGGDTASILARIQTRGHSRLKICDRFPPTRVDFAKKPVKGTVFEHLNRFKLVSPCKVATEYEQYVLQEYNLYRLHALFTPYSHRTRLLRMTVVDSASGKAAFTKYAFAVEDIDEVGERMDGAKMKATGLFASDLVPRQLAIMSVLQYMIGNTDFSITARHNAEFITHATGIYLIIYDYDQAGAVNAPYAIPDPSLGIRKVTDRLYRGLCVPRPVLDSVLKELVDRRKEVDALYEDATGKLLRGMHRSQTMRFIDDFYETIKNPRDVQREIVARCAEGR